MSYSQSQYAIELKDIEMGQSIPPKSSKYLLLIIALTLIFDIGMFIASICYFNELIHYGWLYMILAVSITIFNITVSYVDSSNSLLCYAIVFKCTLILSILIIWIIKYNAIEY